MPAAKPSHPLVDAAHVREPCTAEWDAMEGSDRIRFCASCRKDVYDLSAFTADEAETLLRGAAGRVCIIVERDAKGRYARRLMDDAVLLGVVTMLSRSETPL